MMSFRGLTWIYDVTTADQHTRARAAHFAHRIARAAEVTAKPPQPTPMRRPGCQTVFVTPVTPQGRQTPSHKTATL
jgi:hypothetical protein